MPTDGPFYSAFKGSLEGVIEQELTTYRMKDGNLVKEVVTRKYQSGGDYIDSYCNTPLIAKEIK